MQLYIQLVSRFVHNTSLIKIIKVNEKTQNPPFGYKVCFLLSICNMMQFMLHAKSFQILTLLVYLNEFRL